MAVADGRLPGEVCGERGAGADVLDAAIGSALRGQLWPDCLGGARGGVCCVLDVPLLRWPGLPLRGSVFGFVFAFGGAAAGDGRCFADVKGEKRRAKTSIVVAPRKKVISNQ